MKPEKWWINASPMNSGENWEEIYQNFKERWWNEFWSERIMADFGGKPPKPEAKEKLTKALCDPALCPRSSFHAHSCHFIFPDRRRCGHKDHPSNKPPEPECEHGKHRQTKRRAYYYYKDHGDKHCRDCGDKL